MSKFESKIKVVKGSPRAIYEFLADMSRLRQALPEQLAQGDMEVSADECAFTVDKLGRVAVSVAERTPFSTVRYAMKAAVPVGIDLYVQIKEAPVETPEPESRIKVSLVADIPMMLKPLLGSKLQQVVDNLAETLALRPY